MHSLTRSNAQQRNDHIFTKRLSQAVKTVKLKLEKLNNKFKSSFAVDDVCVNMCSSLKKQLFHNFYPALECYYIFPETFERLTKPLFFAVQVMQTRYIQKFLYSCSQFTRISSLSQRNTTRNMSWTESSHVSIECERDKGIEWGRLTSCCTKANISNCLLGK